MESGLVNFLLRCSAHSDVEDDGKESVIIRVFGDYAFHRQSEVHFMTKLSEKNIIPPLFCR